MERSGPVEGGLRFLAGFVVGEITGKELYPAAFARSAWTQQSRNHASVGALRTRSAGCGDGDGQPSTASYDVNEGN